MITRDEWLKALADVGLTDEHDDAALTIQEFADMFSIPRTTANSRIQMLLRAGKATPTMKWLTTSYGRRLHLKAYRLNTPTPAKRKRA